MNAGRPSNWPRSSTSCCRSDSLLWQAAWQAVGPAGPAVSLRTLAEASKRGRFPGKTRVVDYSMNAREHRNNLRLLGELYASDGGDGGNAGAGGRRRRRWRHQRRRLRRQHRATPGATRTRELRGALQRAFPVSGDLRPVAGPRRTAGPAARAVRCRVWRTSGTGARPRCVPTRRVDRQSDGWEARRPPASRSRVHDR